jgi:hypothetical protein
MTYVADLSQTTTFVGEVIPPEPVFGRGEFGRVWNSMIVEVLGPTCGHPLADDHIWAEIFREYPKYSRFSIAPEVVAGIVDDTEESRSAVLSLRGSDFVGELAVVGFIESIYLAIEENYQALLASFYRERLVDFVDAHSTRYSITGSLRISVSLSGIVESILASVRGLAGEDVGVQLAMEGVELALADLREGATPARIKVCIQRETNLLEAVAQAHPDVRTKTLSDHVKELNTWPHRGVSSSLSSLYGFASDYPGIRHAGNVASALRDLDSRDAVAMSTLMFGYLPYLLDSTLSLGDPFRIQA